MSIAIGRIGSAMKKLESAEYVHVTGVRTGDELEDLASGFNTMVEGLRERDNLRATFGKYMTESVMEHLLSGKVQLGGETLTATVLFADIRSFTTISESMDAHALVSLLNEYFSEMVAIISQEGGVVDKYIGDAIMAVFGVPVPKPDDALRAVRAAARMREALVKLNERLAAKGKPTLRIGIGLHTGELVAGNIGSEARMEYTVIGDAVNLASRLEGATKDLGADVVVSGETQALVAAACRTRFLAEVTVKGRAAPVKVYAIESIPDPPPQA
jgi:adenylate cyclase